ncbi:MAG: hypothetical protein WCS37_16090 [Chloroflexota bacterium]|nr:hypothetical protein [Chloroflexota bacterium]
MKKHEREIRELLDKMDNFLPDSPPVERGEREPKKKVVSVMPPVPQPIPIRKKSAFTPGAWLREHKISTGLACLILGFALVISGLIVWQNFPVLRWLAQALVAGGAIVYLLPVLLRFFTGRDLNDSNDGPKYWRGQSLDTGFSWQNVRRWFQGRKRRPNNDPWNERKRNNR